MYLLILYNPLVVFLLWRQILVFKYIHDPCLMLLFFWCCDTNCCRAAPQASLQFQQTTETTNNKWETASLFYYTSNHITHVQQDDIAHRDVSSLSQTSTSICCCLMLPSSDLTWYCRHNVCVCRSRLLEYLQDDSNTHTAITSVFRL